MAQTSFRKRGRCPLEDEVEFMPLSKRINNLHILENNHPTAIRSEFVPPTCNLVLKPYDYQTGAINNNADAPHPSSTILPQYTPDLDENQNPHYFAINKLLFEMYVARLQRGT